MRFHLFDKASGDWSHIEAYDLGGVQRDHLGDKHLMPLVPDYGKAAILLQDAQASDIRSDQ